VIGVKENNKGIETRNEMISSERDDHKLSGSLRRGSTFFNVDSTEVIEQLKKDCEPMKLTNFMIERPCVVIIACYTLMIIISAFTLLGGLF